MDIPFNQSKEQFQQFFTNLVNNNFFDSTTRAFFIQFTIYDTISDYFIVFDMLAEFLVSGNIYPTYIKILPFKGNIFELTEEKFLQTLDIFRFILCFYYLYQIYIKLRYQRPKVNLLNYDDDDDQNNKKSDYQQSNNPSEDFAIYTLALMIDLGIVFFFFFAWIQSYLVSDR